MATAAREATASGPLTKGELSAALREALLAQPLGAAEAGHEGALGGEHGVAVGVEVEDLDLAARGEEALALVPQRLRRRPSRTDSPTASRPPRPLPDP